MMTKLSAGLAWRTTSRLLLAVTCLALAPSPVCAQRATATAPLPAAAQSPAPGAVAAPLAGQQSAEDIRRQLDELLREHPPTVREVLQREPALLVNADYLAPYPRLAAVA